MRIAAAIIGNEIDLPDSGMDQVILVRIGE